MGRPQSRDTAEKLFTVASRMSEIISGQKHSGAVAQGFDHHPAGSGKPEFSSRLKHVILRVALLGDLNCAACEADFDDSVCSHILNQQPTFIHTPLLGTNLRTGLSNSGRPQQQGHSLGVIVCSLPLLDWSAAACRWKERPELATPAAPYRAPPGWPGRLRVRSGRPGSAAPRRGNVAMPPPCPDTVPVRSTGARSGSIPGPRPPGSGRSGTRSPGNAA